MIRQILDHPQVSPIFKNHILKSAEHPELSAIKLTSRVRKEYGVTHRSEGRMIRVQGRVRKWARPELETLRNDEVQLDDIPELKSQFLILAPDGSHSKGTIAQLSYLIHELAHVRFGLYLEQNIERLAKIFPESQIRYAGDGIWEMNAHLQDLLEERYTLQSELALLREVYGPGKLIDEPFPKYSDLDSYEPTLQNQLAISAYVIKTYKITDREVLTLRYRTLDDILRNGMPNEPAKLDQVLEARNSRYAIAKIPNGSGFTFQIDVDRRTYLMTIDIDPEGVPFAVFQAENQEGKPIRTFSARQKKDYLEFVAARIGSFPDLIPIFEKLGFFTPQDLPDLYFE